MTSAYRTPTADIVTILDAPPSPSGFLSFDRRTLLLADYEAYPPLSVLAKPFLKLAGLRVDPTISGHQRTLQYTAFRFVDVETGNETPVTGIPNGSRMNAPAWTNDSVRFAFTRDTESGIEIGVVERATGTARFLPNLRVSDVLTGAFSWCDDGKTLLVAMIPGTRGDAPTPPLVPASPVISETAGKFTKASTYQDLLTSDADAALFRHFTTVQWAFVNTQTGEITPIGAPNIYAGAAKSPDEKYLLVSRVTDVSFRVPVNLFGKVLEVWDTKTSAIHTVADLPVRDEVPQQGVTTGVRGVTWQGNADATLLWAEALDGGDPLAKVPHRDALFSQNAPFDTAPREVLRLKERYAGWDWFAKTDDVLLAEYDRDRKWRTTYRLSLSAPHECTVLFDRSINDAYNAPGSPVYEMTDSGRQTILQRGSTIFLSGAGATPQGNRPFLRSLRLDTGETTELWRCGDDGYEAFIAFLPDCANAKKDCADDADICTSDDNICQAESFGLTNVGANCTNVDGDCTKTGRILTTYQTVCTPANFFRTNIADGCRDPVTFFADPHPQITGLHKELVTYRRESDNVALSGTLYLPPNFDPKSGAKLPLLFWAYPEEYTDAATAGQVRGSDQTFTRLVGTSPLWFVTQGYAVLLDATVPVVGDPETANDTFVPQIVGAAKAAIDYLSDERGIVDRTRVICAGHSYGAFMTANLLAHSDLFAAGIARSGAYNRTLTPFGFQSERRSYWEAPDVYKNLSPFTFADKITAPLLLIHGQSDNNPGTHTLQSERFYQALAAHGATAKLVLLPHESHGYRARESVLHVLAECFEWAERFVVRGSSTLR